MIFIGLGELIVIDILFVSGAVEFGWACIDFIEGFKMKELGHGEIFEPEGLGFELVFEASGTFIPLHDFFERYLTYYKYLNWFNW